MTKRPGITVIHAGMVTSREHPEEGVLVATMCFDDGSASWTETMLIPDPDSETGDTFYDAKGEPRG